MNKENIETIEWESAFDTGIDRIDFEHKVFLELLNSFKKAMDSGSNSNLLIKILIEIEKYAEFHFISEENFMLFINYPNYKKHQIKHFELLEQFNLAKYEQMGFQKFYDFIQNWFITHTVNEDIKIKEYVIENNISFEDSYYNISF